jgi:hypothetical protein
MTPTTQDLVFQSAQLDKLFEALSIAQASMQGAKKDSENPFFKSKYADLHSVWEACKTALTANGLSVSQVMWPMGDKTVLVTILGHSSGQWIKSMLPLPLLKTDVQSLGATITYCRRFALASIVGVSQIDDDGETAMIPARENPKAAIKVDVGALAKVVLDSIQLEHDEHLVEYMNEVQKLSKGTLPSVVQQWLGNPERLKEFYGQWIVKKGYKNG